MDKHQEIAALLEAREWTFAKTMADVPHWYSLRWQWPSDADFVRVVDFIKTDGLLELYGKHRYKCLIVNGFKYWAMAGHKAPKPFTFGRWDIVVINRKPISDADAAILTAASVLLMAKSRKRKPRPPDPEAPPTPPAQLNQGYLFA